MKTNTVITSGGTSTAAAAEKPFPPLVRRLVEELGWPLISDEAALDALAAAAAETDMAVVLLCAGDHVRHPEVLDVAVVLPELVKHFAGRLMPAVAARAAEDAFRQRFDFYQWPSLVFLRGESHLGTISKMQDWQVYLQRTSALLDGSGGEDGEASGAAPQGGTRQ